MSAPRALAIWAALAVLALAVLAASLALGSVALSLPQVLHALAVPGILSHAGATSQDANAALGDEIVRGLRLPRALAAFACGGLLSLAGALLQALLRNPLADPYVLGVAGGAASFALGAMLLMLPWWWVDAGAAGGAFCATLLVLALAHREFRGGEHGASSPRLLLTGVVLAAGWYAIVTLLLTLAPDGSLRGMVFWLTGDLDGATRATPALIVLAAVLACATALAPQLNALLRGEAVAQALGVHVARVRLAAYLLASLATAAAVVTCGTIGFVGLVVPHMLRLGLGNDQRMLLPASALAGGVFLMLADLAARTVIAPAQLPVGVITALAGVPVFLWMLLGRRR